MKSTVEPLCPVPLLTLGNNSLSLQFPTRNFLFVKCESWIIGDLLCFTSLDLLSEASFGVQGWSVSAAFTAQNIISSAEHKPH